MDHKDALGDFIEAGISDDLRAAFRNLEDAGSAAPGGDPKGSVPKYSDHLIKRLRRAIACRNYAKSVVPLCHLVNAADAMAAGPGQGYVDLFFRIQRVSANGFRGYIDDAVARRGWRRPGFDHTRQGITIEYADGRTEIHYSGMPFLCALLEFLITIASYTEIDKIFSTMLEDASSERAINKASSAVSRQIYDYLRNNLQGAQNLRKFKNILNFLRLRGDEDGLVVDDGAVLEFWIEQSYGDGAGDSRTYRTVLAGFVDFCRTLGTTTQRRALDHATTIGSDRQAKEIDPPDALDQGATGETGDREEGEIDPDLVSGALEIAGQWQSPLRACDSAPANRIKFLTKAERQTIDLVMDCGPEALRLPVSVLRAETFGKTQARLTQARRDESRDLSALIGGAKTASYKDCEAGHRSIVAHIHKVMLASLYVLTQARERKPAGNVVAFKPGNPKSVDDSYEPEPSAAAPDARPMEEAATAFNAFSRKGFGKKDLADPEIIEGHRIAAGSLAAAKAHLDDFLSIIASLDMRDPDLAGLFAKDRGVFDEQFLRLYGEAS